MSSPLPPPGQGGDNPPSESDPVNPFSPGPDLDPINPLAPEPQLLRDPISPLSPQPQFLGDPINPFAPGPDLFFQDPNNPLAPLPPDFPIDPLNPQAPLPPGKFHAPVNPFSPRRPRPQEMERIFGPQGTAFERPPSELFEDVADRGALRSLAESLAAREHDFRIETSSVRPFVWKRSQPEDPVEVLAPVLRDALDVAAAFDEGLTRKLASYEGQGQPFQVGVRTFGLSVIALGGGASFPLDCAHGPLSEEDLLFVSAFDRSGEGSATLRIRRVKDYSGFVAIPLSSGHAVLIPGAYYPADISDVETRGDGFADRLYVVVAHMRPERR